MNLPRTTLSGFLSRLTARLRFPQLFALVLALFLFDLLIPDFIPLIDEILLGLLAILLGNWTKEEPRERRAPTEVETGTVIDVPSPPRNESP